MIKINTKHMFLERLSPEDREKHKPLYTMQEVDVKKHGTAYISMYGLYMKSVDEYDFATVHLGGMPIWNALLDTKWFSEGYRCHRGIEAWREDMRARDESTAKKVLLLAAGDGDVSAARKVWDLSKKEADDMRKSTKKKDKTTEAAAKEDDRDFLDSAALRLNVVSIRD